jgi:hypothetical protein
MPGGSGPAEEGAVTHGSLRYGCLDGPLAARYPRCLGLGYPAPPFEEGYVLKVVSPLPVL